MRRRDMFWGPCIWIATMARFGKAEAEICSLVGCGLGYIFMPGGTGLGSFGYNGKTCRAPEDTQTFETAGLPPINQVVVLKSARILHEEQNIQKNIDQYQPAHIDTGRPDCKPIWGEPAEGNKFHAGDKVRILGYRTFVGHWTLVEPARDNFPGRTRVIPQQLLFALVLPA